MEMVAETVTVVRYNKRKADSATLSQHTSSTFMTVFEMILEYE